MCFDKLKKHSDHGYLLMRVFTGLVLLMAGWGKISAGVDGFAGMLAGIGLPLAGLLAWVVALVELVGGAALILGLYTRTAASLNGIVMLVAVLLTWFGGLMGGGFDPSRLAFVLLGALAVLATSGAGKMSLDAKYKIKC